MKEPAHKILIFDSGVGGLSVYQAIQSRYPQLEFVYLFDNEGYPYGELAADILIARATKLISAMVKKEGIDLVVIACNTASTIVLPALRQILDIPVVGVVPAIKPAAMLSQKAIGLIATPATIKRPYTIDLIQEFAPNIEVQLLGTTELVLMAEQKIRGEIFDKDELKRVLAPLMGEIDVAVLGCTHFPLLKDEIQHVLGAQVTLVDSGEAIAKRIGDLLGINTQSQFDNKKSFPIYSSATPKNEVALNKAVKTLGFNNVRLFPLQDV